ncbi:hypothetical protein [Rhizobium sp. SL42]|uniref:hypothetical protein n=1 Tax=Rhizobium sp. SL42 TaxID=2806346 RepID=UPI001F3518EA|nr:hypothetical protein [Rhizobium sp. SL42]UJW75793.1 hypothetical protein IM739_04655 [Rhizobium sp. SL42]
MYISITFPVADFRHFHPSQAGRLGVPAWGSSDPRAKFARGFGAIHTRTKSGDGFLGENYYADCQNFIRYPELKFVEPLSQRQRRVLTYPIYRRFFFDGLFSGRFELGFRLNEESIWEIEAISKYRGEEVLYDIAAIAKQMLQSTLSLHLLDERVQTSAVLKAPNHLRDGYLLSSTKTGALSEYDLTTVGSRYVGVGTPFLVVRVGNETPLVQQKRARTLLDDNGVQAFTISSGATQQGFDTFVINSPNSLNEESPKERLVRLFYTQIRTILFAHSYYLDGYDKGTFPKFIKIHDAVSALVTRLESLPPIEDDKNDAETCRIMSDILKKSDVDITMLTGEITKHLKPSWLQRKARAFFKIMDRKSDVAIEAAATAATQRLLGGN